MLKAHHKQRSAAELYQVLAVTCQGPKETEEDFLIRVLEFRQQVLFTSRVIEDGIEYSADQPRTQALSSGKERPCLELVT